MTADRYIIFGLTVDVPAPDVVNDSVGLQTLTGVGRLLDERRLAIGCFEDQANPVFPGEPDWNDGCWLIPPNQELSYLGGLSAYVGHNTAQRDGGNVRFTSPEGTWVTGTEHVWVGYVQRSTNTPEPATYALLGGAMLAALLCKTLRRKA